MIHPGYTWFCCYTEPKAEKRAEIALLELGFEVFLPVAIYWSRKGVTRPTSGRRRSQSTPRVKITKPLYDRYVFVGLEDPEDWGDAKRADGVVRLVGPNFKPTVVDKDALYELRIAMARGTFDYATEQVWETGQKIRVVKGAMADFTGRIEEMRNGDQVKLALWDRLLRREREFVCSLDDLEQVA